jgi:hypothetical protein
MEKSAVFADMNEKQKSGLASQDCFLVLCPAQGIELKQKYCWTIPLLMLIVVA